MNAPPPLNNRPLRIIVSGMIAADPNQGGATWAVLQYVLGLQRLGHEVCFIEPVPEKALKPKGCTLADSASAAYFRKIVADFGLAGRAALLLAGTEETVGLTYAELRAVAARYLRRERQDHTLVLGELVDERADDAGDLPRDLRGRVVLVDEPAGRGRGEPRGNCFEAPSIERPPQPE